MFHGSSMEVVIRVSCPVSLLSYKFSLMYDAGRKKRPTAPKFFTPSYVQTILKI